MAARYLASVLATSTALIPAAPTLAQDCVPEVVTVTPTLQQAKDVLIQGDLAYVTDEFGFLIFDISDPTSPQELAVFGVFQFMLGVAVSNNIAYICEADVTDSFGYVEIVDVSDPANPVLLNRTFYDERPIAASVKGDTAYVSMGHAVSDDRNFLLVLDVSDPADPQPVTSIPTRRWPHGSLIQGDLLYLALRAGFDIYDISSPRDPVLLGTTDVQNLAIEVVVQDGFAYLAEFSRGMRILDVRDPTNPVSVATVETPSRAFGVAVLGDLALVVHERAPAGMLVVDVRNPLSPMVIGSLGTKWSSWGVDMVSHYALVANSVTGLLAVDLTSCAPCPADLDGDRDADSKDFFFFLDAFAANNLDVCDIDGDRDCDAEDFFTYLDLFAAGC